MVFPEVPAYCLEEPEWAVRAAGRWSVVDDISILEGRALLGSVQQAVMSGARDRRVMFLVDKSGVSLAFARSRVSVVCSCSSFTNCQPGARVPALPHLSGGSRVC